MLKKVIRFLSNRLVLFVLLILLQLYVFLKFYFKLPQQVFFILGIIGFLIVLHLVNSKQNQSFSIAWIIIILMFPGVGVITYLLFANKKVPKNLRNFYEQGTIDHKNTLIQDQGILDNLSLSDYSVFKQFFYVYKNGGFPVYKNTKVDYFPVGEEKFESMLNELKKAKKYIFLEYFIVREGIMWDSILEILIKKASEGVDVRVMYDDVGTISNLPKDYHHKLEAHGIKVHIFNKLRPLLMVTLNNRDHRKILSIDGKVGFLGGINLGDEYVNKLKRFGHWKDSAVMLEGEAVWSLTVMFLQFWNAAFNIKEDINKYNPHYKVESNGLIQPYSDSPTDSEPLGENIHLNIINHAKKYLYIMTPYLIPSHEMLRMLILSSKNGVDVRIVVPYLPDKWYVHAISKSNYQILLENNIRVFEYKPGFIHSKNFIADDKMGIVGSTNIDYRSYYLNFESGAIFYNHKSVLDLKADFYDTFEKSIEITLEDIKNVSLIKRLIRAFVGLFSPLL